MQLPAIALPALPPLLCLMPLVVGAQRVEQAKQADALSKEGSTSLIVDGQDAQLAIRAMQVSTRQLARSTCQLACSTSLSSWMTWMGRMHSWQY